MTETSPMSTPAKPLQLLALSLLLGACATTTVDSRRRAPEPGLYGVADGRLVTVGKASSSRARARRDQAAAIDDVSAMTWDPATQRFYAIAGGSRRPRLIAVDPATGEATAIGPIASFGLGLTIADALAIDPRGKLYATGGASTFASGVLLTVDPATGAAKQVARIRGTIQGEVDAMTFAGDELYAVDSAGNSAALYRIDPDTGKASRVNEPFPGTVTDLAFDPASRRLFGVQGKDAPLITLSLDGDVGEMPAAGELRAVAIIPAAAGASLFENGFESGDDSAWSQRTKQEP